MFVVIGWVVVIASVIGSFVGVGGHLAALFQPFELLCIFGAAIGASLVIVTMLAFISASRGVTEFIYFNF